MRRVAKRDAALNGPTPRGTAKKRSTIALLMPPHSPENQTPIGCASLPKTPRLLKATAEANTRVKPPRQRSAWTNSWACTANNSRHAAKMSGTQEDLV